MTLTRQLLLAPLALGCEVGAASQASVQPPFLDVYDAAVRVDFARGVGDVDGDGSDDLYVFSDGDAGLLLGPFEGDLTPGELLWYPRNGGFSMISVEAGDFDGDGDDDVGNWDPTAGELALWLLPSPRLTPTPDTTLGMFGPGEFERAGDVDGDGVEDFLAHGAYLFHGPLTSESTGHSLFPMSSPWDPPPAFAFALGDVNGDGIADLGLELGGDPSRLGIDEIALVYGPLGTERVAEPWDASLHVDTPDGWFTSVDSGDLDGDGYADLIVGRYREGSRDHSYALSGGAALGGEVEPVPGTFGALCDLDDDGHLDLVRADPGRVQWWRGPLTQGAWPATPTWTWGDGPRDQFLVADFGCEHDLSGDGKADLLRSVLSFAGGNHATREEGIAYVIYGGPDLVESR